MNTVLPSPIAGFASALLDPYLPAPSSVHTDARIDAERRFAVHRNTFVATLIDAMRSSFPVVHALLGDEFFRAMARERVINDPPRSPVLTRYAAGFSDFIAGFEPTTDMPWLVDIARLEALRIEATHAADAEPLPAAAFAPLIESPQRLATTRISLHPALRWLRSKYAVLDVWRAHQHVDADDVDLDGIGIDTPQSVAITRAHLDVDVIELPPGGADWLDAINAGATLAEAFDAVDGVADPAALFALLIGHGLAQALHTDGTMP